MVGSIVETLYFDSPGAGNTEETLRAARRRAKELEIRDVVVASTTGETGVKACEVFKGFNLVIVRHHTGYRGPGIQEMNPKHEKKILESGARILTAAHALSGIERSIRRKFGTVGPLEIMAETLRVFGEGVKVCVEITVMAADAGLIPIDTDIVAVAGTSRGADTALVIRPAHSNDFFSLTVKEIIAKPREK